MITEYRPWGWYEVLYSDQNTWLKKLYISPGQSLSLQTHQFRDEWWYPLNDGVIFDDGKNKTQLEAYETYYCLRGEKHRLMNSGQEVAVVVEWAVGFPTEEDIVRLSDDYGR